MDIRKGYKTSIKFAVPTDLVAAQATVYKDNVQIGSLMPATVASGVATVNLPYNVVKSAGEWRVQLAFNYEASAQTLSKSGQIVTPYLDLWELREMFPDTTITDTELWSYEAAAR